MEVRCVAGYPGKASRRMEEIYQGAQAIRLNTEADEIAWSRNRSRGVHTAKLGYQVVINEEKVRNRGGSIVLTWVNCKKNVGHLGQGRDQNCVLCKEDQYIDCLLVHCPFSKEIWERSIEII